MHNSLLQFFWHHLNPYKWFVSIFLITGLFWGIHTSLSPYLIKLIIDNIANYTGAKKDIFEVIKIPFIIYISAWIFMAFNFRLTNWVSLRIFPSIRQDITNSMFKYLTHHSYQYMQNNFAGSLSNKIMDMSGSTASLFDKFEEIISHSFVFIIALATMSIIHPMFSAILLIWAIIFMGITLFFNKTTKFLSHEFAVSKSTLSGKIVDSVTNLINIRIFARNSYESKRLASAVQNTVNKDRTVQWHIIKIRIFWDLTFILLMGGMLSMLVFMYSQNKITIGDFAFIMTVSLNIFQNIWYLSSQFVQIAEDLGKCSQAHSILTAPHDIKDYKNAKPINITKGEIIFSNVSFHYNKGHNIFENKNITILPEEKIGLVGLSGSGKSSFVNLILRFFEIESGKITIDGQNINHVTQDSLRESISIIPQETSLFHRSLIENIKYSKLDASEAEVISASKKAHCHEFIEQLPEGYNTLVGERGIKLSGGQRQRIAIARAFLKNAPILILDEATSALDSITEKHIQESLHELMLGRTTIVIAHRLSTLSEMDRVLVFDKGHIIEDGSHNTLMDNNSHYARMWKMQAGGFLPN